MSDDVKTTKVCCDCKTEKLIENYDKNKTNCDGRLNRCKKCETKRRNKLKQERSKQFTEDYYTKVESNEKQCSQCKELKQLKYFGKDKNRHDGYHCFCKNCQKENSQRNRDTSNVSSWGLEYYQRTKGDYKKCAVCEELKLCRNFHRNRHSQDGYHYTCKICTKEKNYKSYEKRYVETLTDENRNETNPYYKRRSKNECVKCGKPVVDTKRGKGSQCKLHHIQSMINSSSKLSKIEAAKILLEKLEKNPYCPYTKEFLEIGKNASLDHKKPKSKYPELISDIDNLEWVSWTANKLKSNIEKEEFLKICRKIAKNNPD